MARVIAIANQKGGVGKTTTAVNLAASLAIAEQRTLLIDGDPQGNATSGIGLAGEQITGTVYDALIGQSSLDEVILRAIQFAHLDVAPTTPDLAGAEIELIDRENRELVMRDALAPVRDRYDYILIDCPPSLGLLTINMLAAADAVLIPVQCEYYALEGLSQLLNTVHRIQQSVNSDLAIDGVLLTMYDARLNLSRQVVTDAREYFGPKVFETIIPRNVRLAEAPSFGKPIVLYDIASVGAQAYLSVARELVERDSQSHPTPEPAAQKKSEPTDSSTIGSTASSTAEFGIVPTIEPSHTPEIQLSHERETEPSHEAGVEPSHEPQTELSHEPETEPSNEADTEPPRDPDTQPAPELAPESASSLSPDHSAPPANTELPSAP